MQRKVNAMLTHREPQRKVWPFAMLKLPFEAVGAQVESVAAVIAVVLLDDVMVWYSIPWNVRMTIDRNSASHIMTLGMLVAYVGLWKRRPIVIGGDDSRQF